MALAIVLAALGACAAPLPPPPPPEPQAPIEIVSPERPVQKAVVVRAGSFVRSNASPEGMRLGFRRTLEGAGVFARVLDAPPENAEPSLDLVLIAADFGEPNAYSFELQVLVVRERDPIASYVTKQTLRQTGRGQLTLGPTELGQLAERAIRDLVRQMAADTERLEAL